MDGAAAAAAYDHYYTQQQQQQQQTYQQHHQQQGPNPYADHGMSGSYYHRLPVDRPMSHDDAGAAAAGTGFGAEMQAYFQQQQQASHDPFNSSPPSTGQQQAPFPSRTAAAGGGGGAASPLGADTILDGEGMPFANRRASGRRSGSSNTAAAAGAGAGTNGYLALPNGVDGEGSLLPYTTNNRYSSASADSSLRTKNSSSNGGGGGEGVGLLGDGRKSVRTSDGALFTIAAGEEK